MRACTLLFAVLIGCSPGADPAKDGAETAELVPDLAPDLALAVHDQVATILVATWTQDGASAATWVEYSFEESTLTTPVIARAAGPAQASLLGIPADTEVRVRVYNQDEGLRTSEEQLATTGSLPEGLVIPALESWDAERSSPEPWMLVTLDTGIYWYFGPFYAVIVDRRGRVVWYWEVPLRRTSLYAQPGWDGSHLFIDGNATFVFDPEVSAATWRLTLDLARLDTIEIPTFRFAIDEEENGSVLFAREGEDGWSLARRDAEGAETDLWSCTDYLEARGYSDLPCSANTLVWDAERRTAMYSMPQIDTVIELDADTGEVLKQFGGLAGGWTISPASAAIDFQHYAHWTPDGTILLSTHVPDEEGAMRAREYSVDEDSQTLSEIWSYGEGGGHYAKLNGEAVRLANGNTLIGYGTEGTVLELDPDDEIVWELRWPERVDPGTWLIGHAALLADLYALNGEGSP